MVNGSLEGIGIPFMSVSGYPSVRFALCIMYIMSISLLAVCVQCRILDFHATASFT